MNQSFFLITTIPLLSQVILRTLSSGRAGPCDPLIGYLNVTSFAMNAAIHKLALVPQTCATIQLPNSTKERFTYFCALI